MAVFRPFKGLRPPRNLASRIASPPYDVINTEEARIMAADNPYSFLHVVKPEIDLDPSTSLYDQKVYDKAAENLNDFIRNGWLLQDSSAMFYLYRQIMGEQSQCGLVGCVSVSEYHDDLIKKHEYTRKEKEDDRTKHVSVLNANAGPVFLTYRARREIDETVENLLNGDPEYDFTSDDGVRHTFWPVNDPGMVGRLEEEFGKVDCLYVADGHHRSASAARVGEERKAANPGHSGREEYNYFLAVLFPDEQLQILAYNRAVNDLSGHTAGSFLEKLHGKFVVEQISTEGDSKPEKSKVFGMYLDGKWYRLEARHGSYDPADLVDSLDVSILQNNLLAPILGVNDPRTDDRIRFVGGIRGSAELERLVDNGECAVSFSLYPTTVAELMAIADAGKVMPPKSTWFEPKLRSGMVVHLLD